MFAELVKAAARKYLKRIATGNPKRPWRYVYHEPSDKKSGGGVSLTERAAPLDYKVKGVQRIAISDDSAKPSSEEYFENSKEVAFLDYSLYDGDRRVYIHYMNTRFDRRGEGHGRALVNELYERFKGKEEINWGKIMDDHAESLFREFSSAGKVPTYGKIW